MLFCQFPVVQSILCDLQTYKTPKEITVLDKKIVIRFKSYTWLYYELQIEKTEINNMVFFHLGFCIIKFNTWVFHYSEFYGTEQNYCSKESGSAWMEVMCGFSGKKKKSIEKKEILKPRYPHFHVCILVIKLFSLKSYWILIASRKEIGATLSGISHKVVPNVGSRHLGLEHISLVATSKCLVQQATR